MGVTLYGYRQSIDIPSNKSLSSYQSGYFTHELSIFSVMHSSSTSSSDLSCSAWYSMVATREQILTTYTTSTQMVLGV